MFRIGTVRMFDDMVIQNFGDDGVLDNPDGTGTQDDGTALAVDNGGILRQQGHAIVQGKMEFFSSVLVQLRGIEATGQVRLGSLANVQFRDQAREGFSDINDPGIPDRFALRGTIRASRNSVVSFGQKLKVALREVNVSRHSGVSFGRLSTIDLGQVDLFFNADVSLSDNSTVTAGNVTLGTGSRFSGGGDNVSFTANDISLFRFSEFSLFSNNSVATVRYLDVNEDSRFNLGSNQVLNLSGTPNNPDRCEGIVCMFDSGFIGVGDNSRISPTDNAFLTYDIGSQSRITLNSNAQLDGRARFGRDSRLDAFGNSVVINGDIDAFDGSELNFGSNATLNGNIDAGQARLSANGDFTMTGDLGMQDVGGHLPDRFTLTGQIQASGNNVEFFSIGNEASVSGDIFVFFGANVGFGDDATVGNNIEVQSGNFSAGQGSTVQGNITAQFNGSFFIAAGATVGNVLASDSGAVTIRENAQINGNAEARNNGFVFVGGGSTVTGNMSLDANFGSIFLDTAQGNIAINGDLDCEPFGNDPSLSDGSVIPSVGGVLDPECGL